MAGGPLVGSGHGAKRPMRESNDRTGDDPMSGARSARGARAWMWERKVRTGDGRMPGARSGRMSDPFVRQNHGHSTGKGRVSGDRRVVRVV